MFEDSITLNEGEVCRFFIHPGDKTVGMRIMRIRDKKRAADIFKLFQVAGNNPIAFDEKEGYVIEVYFEKGKWDIKYIPKLLE